MNKVDRLLAIVIELQRKGSQRAVDLANRFETSVRTIYRDMQALSESGVPIIGSPGRGYALMEGYFLPPVHFTVEEAVSLLVGTEFVEQLFDPPYALQAKSGRYKIESVLPAHVRLHTEQFRESTKILDTRMFKSQHGLEMATLGQVREALFESKKLRFRYRKASNLVAEQRETTRIVCPYGLVLIRGTWMLIAYCELRNDIRHFRLSRMTEVEMLMEGFERPSDFEIHQYVPEDDRQVLVKLQFQRHLAEAVAEANNFFMESMSVNLETVDVIMRVRQPRDVLPWVLSWGNGVEVIAPEEFRRQIRYEIEKMLERY